MTDFKKIAADGFEINAKTLENNSEDAAARSYMLGIMMAKYLDEEHVKRAKRYVIDWIPLATLPVVDDMYSGFKSKHANAVSLTA